MDPNDTPTIDASLSSSSASTTLDETTKYLSANQSLLLSTTVSPEEDNENYQTDSGSDTLEGSKQFSPIVKSNRSIVDVDENQNHEENDDPVEDSDNNQDSIVNDVKKDEKNKGQDAGDDDKSDSSDPNTTLTLTNFSRDYSTIVIDTTDPYANEEELDLNNLPETVTVLRYEPKNQTIYLVGTSHFSKQSHKDVRRVIRTIKPASLMLELCRNRLCFLTTREEDILHEAKTMDFSKVFEYMKKNGVVQGLIYMFLLTASARVTTDLELAPGGEFRNAFNEAKLLPKCKIFLGDRPIDITLRRTIASMNIWQRFKMAYACMWGDEKFDEKELEKYKKKDALEQLIEELSETYPGLSKVMVEERDQYLTHSLYKACLETAAGENIVGVVGIGHSAGIEKYWKDAPTISLMSAELVQIPEHKPTLAGTVIKFSIYGTLGVVVYRYVIPKSVKLFTQNITIQALNGISNLYRSF